MRILSQYSGSVKQVPVVVQTHKAHLVAEGRNPVEAQAKRLDDRASRRRPPGRSGSAQGRDRPSIVALNLSGETRLLIAAAALSADRVAWLMPQSSQWIETADDVSFSVSSTADAQFDCTAQTSVRQTFSAQRIALQLPGNGEWSRLSSGGATVYMKAKRQARHVTLQTCKRFLTGLRVNAADDVLACWRPEWMHLHCLPRISFSYDRPDRLYDVAGP